MSQQEIGEVTNIESSDNLTSKMTGSSNNEPKAGVMESSSAFLRNPRNLKVLLLFAMVLQNSSLALVGRYTRANVPKDDLYIVNHLVLVIEVGKFLLSCCAEFYHTSGKLLESFDTFVFKRPHDTLKSLVPALLYLLQNSLLYVALGNLSAPLFQVTYQGKLVTTAIVSVVLLNRKYNIQQWICLSILSVGVAVVVLGEQDGKKEADSNGQNLLLGLMCVTISCFSSAFAGVYFEKVLKKESKDGESQEASLWMRNIQLSFFSVIIAAVQGAFTGESTASATIDNKSYFHGFTFWVWTLVLLQSAGGLLVAAVMKYADNVLKGLATGVSVVLATAVSIVLFGTPITMQFTAGAVLILSSAYYFSNPLPLSLQAMLEKSKGTKSEGVNSEQTTSFLPK